MPFGFVPLKTDSAELPDDAGAGAGKLSLDPLLVGLNVPDGIGESAGREWAAKSSRVIVALFSTWSPPTSDMMVALCPSGPTSKISTSFGESRRRSVSCTVIRFTLVPMPETLIIEG